MINIPINHTGNSSTVNRLIAGAKPWGRRKVALLIIGALFALIISLLALYKHYHPILKAEEFNGTITSVKIDCQIPDSDSVILVDNKSIIIDPGNIADRGEVGAISRDLSVCDNYDEPNNMLNTKSSLIGKKVEVYASKISERLYTLQGSDEFYVRTATDPSAKSAFN